MDYLKKRHQHAKRILDSLNTRKYTLFLDYLNFMYLTYPTRIADATFANTLVRFDRWTHVISSSTLARFSELPFAYFLADREVAVYTDTGCAEAPRPDRQATRARMAHGHQKRGKTRRVRPGCMH